MRIFNVACIPVLLYGCESWILTETSSDTLNCLVRTFYMCKKHSYSKNNHMWNKTIGDTYDKRRTLKDSKTETNHGGIKKKAIEIYWPLFKII
ncbi:unnamed protein product [Brachionus calyciflorus]|uniref:Uncharacterized protein n=1 Tax=Brachionus calyciflorus TaxID=104777 RepID=A0A814GAA7_9BILA|nr:unnamed protein product [Brachionus calyciflorus]